MTAGKPVVKGTRIPAERVVAHPDVGDLVQAYPELTMEDVKACLRYAYARWRISAGGRAGPACLLWLDEAPARSEQQRLSSGADRS